MKIDNQQVTQLELGWLAGAFDADGHMHMKVYETKRGNNTRIEFGFTNTSREFLCKALCVCSRLGCNLHVSEKATIKGKEYWSKAWVIRTSKLTVIARFLNHMIPLLTVKRERAEILLAFCEVRLKLVPLTAKKNLQAVAKKYPYTSEDIWYFNKFIELNRRVTPTTIPSGSRAKDGPKLRAQASQLTCDDIV